MSHTELSSALILSAYSQPVIKNNLPQMSQPSTKSFMFKQLYQTEVSAQVRLLKTSSSDHVSETQQLGAFKSSTPFLRSKLLYGKGLHGLPWGCFYTLYRMNQAVSISPLLQAEDHKQMKHSPLNTGLC